MTPSLPTDSAGAGADTLCCVLTQHTLSLCIVSDTTKLRALRDPRVLDACVGVLQWDTPLERADSVVAVIGSTRSVWPSAHIRSCLRSAAETMFQLSLSAVGKRAVLAHPDAMGAIRHHARASQSPVAARAGLALLLYSLHAVWFP